MMDVFLWVENVNPKHLGMLTDAMEQFGRAIVTKGSGKSFSIDVAEASGKVQRALTEMAGGGEVEAESEPLPENVLKFPVDRWYEDEEPTG